MNHGAAEALQIPLINRSLEPRRQLRWAYYLSLGSFWFLRQMAFARVHVTNAGLTVNGPRRSFDISFAEVDALKFRYLPFVGGWFTLILRDGVKHRISTWLERSDYILDALAMAQPTLVSASDLAHYRRAAIVIDHSAARMEQFFSDLRMLALMQIVFPLALTLAVSRGLGVRDLTDAFLIYALLGLMNGAVMAFVGLLAESFEMFTKNAELLENPLNPLRNMRREKTAKTCARAAHIVLASLMAYWIWI